MDLEKDLLQSEKPTNKWLTKDTNKEVIRSVSPDVTDVDNLTDEELNTMAKLIDFVRYSQDDSLNNNEEDLLRPAVGLAAPQVGVNKNMFFARFEWDKENPEDFEEIAAINPKIISRSSQMIVINDGEGCLSVDEDRDGLVPRSYKIVVTYYDFLKKKQIKETLRGYKAIVFQHETEHNHGMLYYDHINKKDPHHTEKDWLYL
ncbi:peptide deformylase [Mesoplasma lactucae ATCC 49193]|uniref:Peptide deformylase n=1 Tax=Mesoplasma lactucae ATCC 49193 TaxID=81460 RepID=A0A291ISU4_9MOLU|nr:peptide deformylase [Mesoplasma lactucae ATCC 49193]